MIVSATRSMTWRSDDSRSAVPRVPRKYFWATMLVAFSDQVGGELHVELLEGDRAVAEVGDPGVAPLPRELVVGVDPVGGEVAADADAGLLGCECHGGPSLGGRSCCWWGGGEGVAPTRNLCLLTTRSCASYPKRGPRATRCRNELQHCNYGRVKTLGAGPRRVSQGGEQGPQRSRPAHHRRESTTHHSGSITPRPRARLCNLKNGACGPLGVHPVNWGWISPPPVHRRGPGLGTTAGRPRPRCRS